MLESARISLRALNAVQLAAIAAAALLLAWMAATVTAGSPDAEGQRRVLLAAARAFAESADADLRVSVADARNAALLLRADESGLSDPERSALLEDWLRHSPRYHDVSLISPAGTVRASSDSTRLGTSVPRQPWLARARDAQAFLAAGDAASATPVEIVLPLGQPGRSAWLQLRLSHAFFSDLAARAGRSLDLAEVPGFTVTGADGRILAGGAAAGQEAGRLAASVPMRGHGEFASPGWLVTASMPPMAEPAGAGRWIPPMPLLGLGLVAVLAAAGLGYALGGRAAQPLQRLAGEPGEAGPEAASRVREIAALAGSLAGRARSADLRLAQAGTGLDRIQGRLQTFEAMSGWTCWEIDPETRQAARSDPDRGGLPLAADRVTDLRNLAARFDPADRPLFDLALEAARGSDGPHDVVLRTRADGPEAGRRILVRFRGDAAGTGRVHALSREIAEGAVSETAEGLNERRRNLVLRQVTDGIVHDFNDVLTVVLANLGVLRRRTLDPDQARLVDAALAGARRGAALTRRVLNLVRGDGDGPAACDVAETAGSALAFLQANILREMPVVNRIPDGLPPALCTERVLEVALLNLAFHIRDQGLHGFAIGAAAHEAEAPTSFGLPAGSYLRLLVASGRRPPGAVMRAGPGRALETVAGLLAEAGAGWRVESDGTGADAFLAEIWLKAGAPAAEPETAPSGLRILLVESDGLVRASLAEALADLGHIVVQAASGQHALDLLHADAAFEAMIADQSMPVMTGLQLAATVVERYPAIRVILASPHGQLPAAARQFLQLDKPFRQTDLVAVLGAAAPRKQAA
ncbi:response regulator [Methylobacterium dankookense]|uniref:histidine kinase n=1 Tax=Methylobacterium dankookense TaxID=560405 RepID=A0A564FYE7_9HYPH|nr:response regulator [Methylobacterium dankookense]GJD58575.1 Regulator of RpoS [Methylobacterium dankookense]VUF12720.1 Sensor kinase CckA [Methylobacterium dankookense]